MHYPDNVYTTTTPQDMYESKRVSNVNPVDWSNPEPADCYQLVIVGAGPAGLAAAELAVSLGAKVALVERWSIGGDCLNTGCIPSKSLIRTSRLYADMRDANRYGAQVPADIQVDFAATMQRVRRIRAHLSGFDSAHRLAAIGVDVFFGDVHFTGIESIAVNGKTLRFKKALIATGAHPNVPVIPGLEQAGYLTNENIFDLTTLPARLLVIGGGPLGCELAQAFCRLGSKTTIAQNMPLFLGGEERDAAQILSDAFARDGIHVRLNTHVVAVRVENGEKLVDMVSDDYKNTIAVDAILTGIGLLPNVVGLNLEAAGVDYDVNSGIHIDDFLCTTNHRIYAAGDVCLQHKYTQTARVAARKVVLNALFRGRERFSSLIIPWCTFTDPEIAHVGLHVREANQLNIPIKTFTVPMHEIDRAVTDSQEAGFVKIHIKENTDQILGATLVARDAGSMINEITLAMMAGIGLRDLAKVVHAYPTQAEAIRQAAEAYRRTRITPQIRSRLHSWLVRNM